jgi:ABC-type transport system involved in multi-copper enzyme maturation permease subunit
MMPSLPSPSASSTLNRPTVIFGRRDYLSVLARLTAMELYKIWRRRLSRVLALIGLCAIVCVFLALFLFALGDDSPQAASLLLPPDSIDIAVQTALTPFTILIIILIGSSVGGEYTQGTVRLLFTRGPTRVQFFLAKISAAFICCLIGILGFMLGGVLLGYLFYLALGRPGSSQFLTFPWLGHTLLFLLLAILNWFIFAVIAAFFGTLGRSSTAGITGGILWFLLEPIVGQICMLGGQLLQGLLSTFLKAVPDYLIGNNLAILMVHQGYHIFGSSGYSSLSDPQALLVLIAYLLILTSVAASIQRRRDISN